MNIPATALITVLSATALASVSFAAETWAPTSGYSSVNQLKAYNEFVFEQIEDVYEDDQTYEQETQVYNPAFAAFDGYWSSNLPGAYYDTPFLDDIDNFTIGSSQGSEFRSNIVYYTYMAFHKDNDSDCTGCCSNHGGVVCNGGVAMCGDGTPLS